MNDTGETGFDVDEVEDAAHSRRPNAVLLALTLLVGAIAGTGSAVVVLEQAWLFLPVSGAAAVTCSVVAWRHRTLRTTEPAWTERLVAAASASLKDGFVVALFALVVYAVFYAGVWIIDWFGWAAVSAGTWGFWAAAVAMVVMIFVPENKQDVADDLFPATPGYELPFRQAAREGRWLWSAGFGVAVVVVTVCIVIWGFGSVAAKVAWILAVFFGGGAAVPDEVTIYEQSDDYDEIVRRLAAALEKGPFTSIVNPITGDEAVDRTLREADILAQAVDGASLLVDVRLAGGPFAWKEAIPIINAAVTLQAWLEDKIEPALVLFEATADDGLTGFAGDTVLHLLEYDPRSGRIVGHGAPEWLTGTIAAAFNGYGFGSEGNESKA